MKVHYLFLRLFRHFMPGWLVRLLLRRRWIIRPGLETDAPLEAVARYRETLEEIGYSLHGKRILILGYGGRYAVGCALLGAGALQVVLCESGIPPDDTYNRSLLPHFSAWLEETGGSIVPRHNVLNVINGDIRELAERGKIDPVDVVLTSSVYEHLDDVEGITSALAKLTVPHGIHLHFVDLRDHFFKYPFEMLTCSPMVWKRLLNPTSNLNRYRLPDYRRLFEKYFRTVEIEILEYDETAFTSTLKRIRPEFLSGDSHVDAATIIRVIARSPLTADA